MRHEIVVTPTLRVPFSELEFSYVRSSGPGGQNVNKVNSKCVMRWNALMSPSLLPPVRARLVEAFGSRLTQEGELVLSSDLFRDQGRNTADCIEKLRQMLLEIARPPKVRKQSKPTRSSQRRRVNEKKAHSQKKALRRGDWD